MMISQSQILWNRHSPGWNGSSEKSQSITSEQILYSIAFCAVIFFPNKRSSFAFESPQEFRNVTEEASSGTKANLVNGTQNVALMEQENSR